MSDKGKSLFKNTDFIVAIVFMVFGAALLQQTLAINNNQSRIFPYAAVVIVFVSAISLGIEAFTGKGAQNCSALINKKDIIMLLMLAGAYMLAEILGFYSSILLFLIFSFLYVEGTWSKAAVKSSLIFNIVLTIILYVSFAVLLGMITPTGLLI